MKVVTFNREKLQSAANALEKEASSFSPDLVVGIASGGKIIADMMFVGTPHVAIKSSRRTTEAKQHLGFLWAIIRHLPTFVKDAMRIVEARYLNNDDRGDMEPIEPDATFVEAVSKADRILIVDDAIDSGRTMKRVVDAIRSVAADKKLAIAVITVTKPQPLVRADYKLYDGGVLVRFPWSKDFKG